MMLRLLHIKKAFGEEMNTLYDCLTKQLEELGLHYMGRVDPWNNKSNFPSVHAFASPGEGGLVIQYERGKKVHAELPNYPKECDATIIPLGTTGSLIQKVYQEIQEVHSPGPKEQDRQYFELRVEVK